jgi:CelD/BcsL family acetyltransferase involved in cellulose biosynthesis
MNRNHAASVQSCGEFPMAERIWEQLNQERTPEDLSETFAGFRAWASSDPRAVPLPLLVASRGDEPQAILPVMRSERQIHGLRLQVLATAGNDHWKAGTPILGRDPEGSLVTLLEALAQERGWHVLELGPMRDDSETLALLLTHAERLGFRPRIARKLEDPVVKMDGAWEDYFESLSSNLRSQVKRSEAKLLREGPVTLEEYLGGAELDQRLEEFFRVEASGWKGREGTAISSEPATREFYSRLAHASAERGELRLHMLRVSGKCIAADYCVASGRTVYMLKVGYDETWSQCSPGQVIRMRVLKHLFAGSDEIYDLMAGGGEHRGYKLRWSNLARTYAMVRLFKPRSVLGQLAAKAYGVQAWIRERKAAAHVERSREGFHRLAQKEARHEA